MMPREDLMERASIIADEMTTAAVRKIRLAKLRLRMRQERARTDAELLHLGEMVYHRMQQGETFDDDFRAVADAIEKHQAMIWQIQTRIDDLE